MAEGYPTKDEIQAFMEANRKGGVEAIENLLREKQAQRAQGQQSQPTSKELRKTETDAPKTEK